MSDVDDPAHGIRGYRRKCRCQICRKAWSEYHAELRKRRKLRPVDEIPHGEWGYQNYGCRCELCALMQMERHRRERSSRFERVDEIPHGTRSGYKGWGCRCDECKAAASVADRLWRAGRTGTA